jgi:hypothetical protein
VSSVVPVKAFLCRNCGFGILKTGELVEPDSCPAPPGCGIVGGGWLVVTLTGLLREESNQQAQ